MTSGRVGTTFVYLMGNSHKQFTDRLTGALADRYRIERQLGQGGMALVFLAEDLRHVDIKVLQPELAASDRLEAILDRQG